MHGNLRINFTLRSLRISKLSYYLPFQNLQPITAHCISSHLLSKMVCRIHQRGPICFVLSNENIKKNHDILCCFRFLPLSHSYLLSTRSLMYKWKEEIPKEKILINILPEKLHLTFPLIDANLHEFLCFLE